MATIRATTVKRKAKMEDKGASTPQAPSQEELKEHIPSIEENLLMPHPT